MADPKLIDILKGGVTAWNLWRDEHPKSKSLDLTEIDLGHHDLRGLNLSGALLKGAYLLGADLSDADLREARLEETNLTGANLKGADLRRAVLSFTDLAYTNLEEANTEGANFNAATVAGQNIATYTPDDVEVEGPIQAAQLPEHLSILMKGVEVWNRWRNENPGEKFPDLIEASLKGARFPGINLSCAVLASGDLSKADLSGSNLRKAELELANLMGANLAGADMSGASMHGVDLSFADLTGADLRGAEMNSVDLTRTVLCNAKLEGADISETRMHETQLEGARLTGCRIYGVSTWDVQGTPVDQSDLILSKGLMQAGQANEALVTIDDIEIAQFIYLILNNSKLRNVIDTIGNKGVLILGRFQEDRKLVLDALRMELRHRNFIPIVFDFDRPTTRDFTETVMTLAGMSLFIIADITAPKSVPLELQATVPNYKIPFVPIIQDGERPFAMLRDLIGKHEWVLDLLEYDSLPNLIAGLEEAVIRSPPWRSTRSFWKRKREI